MAANFMGEPVQNENQGPIGPEITLIFNRIAIVNADILKLRGILLSVKNTISKYDQIIMDIDEQTRVNKAKLILEENIKMALTQVSKLHAMAFQIGHCPNVSRSRIALERTDAKAEILEEMIISLKRDIFRTIRFNHLQTYCEELNTISTNNGIFMQE